MYIYLKERVKHAVRFRHKRGFGVHSPFMFDFILQVVRDRRHKFVYPKEAEQWVSGKRREREFCRLLYRMASYLRVSRICCTGKRAGLISAYVAHVPGVSEVCVDAVDRLSVVDFVVVGSSLKTVQGKIAPEKLLATGEESRCIVIRDIYSNRQNHLLWNELRKEAAVCVDMMWYGILLFDPKLQKGKYNLIL